MKSFRPYSKEENFVFINAWNEWAEGNHLEPDLKWGHEYLEMTKWQLRESKVIIVAETGKTIICNLRHPFYTLRVAC